MLNSPGLIILQVLAARLKQNNCFWCCECSGGMEFWIGWGNQAWAGLFCRAESARICRLLRRRVGGCWSLDWSLAFFSGNLYMEMVLEVEGLEEGFKGLGLEIKWNRGIRVQRRWQRDRRWARCCRRLRGIDTMWWKIRILKTQSSASPLKNSNESKQNSKLSPTKWT